MIQEANPDDVDHQLFMTRAIQQALLAYEADEVPVGAVIVSPDQKVIAAAYNQKIQLKDPTAHAEILAITQAAAALEDWRLNGCTLYVTLEPCAMCAGAILQARIDTVVFGAYDPKAGAVQSLFQLLNDPRLNHRCHVIEGLMADECGQILTAFFQEKRAQGKK
ncbi:MAG: tRNA adenosine(34) deaminase TadA [Pirellulaceae bacterium]|nr:tRNA adenosine(34) deaminase TadA [Pirellulaceae bacterium]